MSILIRNSEPEENPTEDPEDMEKETEEDPNEDLEKHAQKTIPTCGGVMKKKPRMRVHGFLSLTGNFHPYCAAPVEPVPNPVSEAPCTIQEMRMHDPAWITDVVNEWVRDQGGTHRFEVVQCLKAKTIATTEDDRLSYLFDRTLRLGHKVEAIGGEVHTVGAIDDLRARQIEEMRSQRRRDQEDMKKDHSRT
ncbi:unnamed protein product [Lactuca saligna]|uniref:Uncharacterized protein n=1 Tax=Lactuca saligna TaxID=75948 RepID=A0AA35YXD8_LACSI|nr:unnamed protein product [Lactuca saligna]